MISEEPFVLRQANKRRRMQISQRQKASGQPVKPIRPDRTARSEEVIASSGVTFQLWRLYQHAWLICLAFPLVSLMQELISPWHLALGGLALVGFATGYTWLMWPHPVSQEARGRSHSRLSYLLFGALSMLAV